MKHRMGHHISRFWGVKISIFVVIAAVVLGFVVMGLWNWLMPYLFASKTINYWQALGLLILSWILFGGLRHGHGMHIGHWRHRMREKWTRMTPEERAKLHQQLHEYWGDHHHDQEPPLKPEA